MRGGGYPRRGVELWFEVRRFKTINADCVVFSVAVDHEKLVSATNDRIRAFVGRLEWFSHRIVPYEHVCG